MNFNFMKLRRKKYQKINFEDCKTPEDLTERFLSDLKNRSEVANHNLKVLDNYAIIVLVICLATPIVVSLLISIKLLSQCN